MIKQLRISDMPEKYKTKNGGDDKRSSGEKAILEEMASEIENAKEKGLLEDGAVSDDQTLDSIYSDAFLRLLTNRSVHEKGVSYPNLSKAALTELENNHEDAESLYQAVLSSVLS